MSKPFVVVATPCFGGLVNQSYMLSVLKLMQLASGGEFELDVVLMGGDSLITRSRSVLVSRFLDSPRATHLMFVDAERYDEVLADLDRLEGYRPGRSSFYVRQAVTVRKEGGEETAWVYLAGPETARRLSDVEPPRFEDNETTIDQLKARIAKTVAFLKTLDPKKIDSSGDREITFPLGPTNKGHMKGDDYLNHFVLPNVYFHLTAAYAILRHCGVEIGKQDFLGAIPMKMT